MQPLSTARRFERKASFRQTPTNRASESHKNHESDELTMNPTSTKGNKHVFPRPISHYAKDSNHLNEHKVTITPHTQQLSKPVTTDEITKWFDSHSLASPMIELINNQNIDQIDERTPLNAKSSNSIHFLHRDISTLQHILRSSPILSALLLIVPLGCTSPLLFTSTGVFCATFFSLIPLAYWLGLLTEELALHSNPTLGGLINASCGNLTELIVSLIALKNASKTNDPKEVFGFVALVQSSLLGSILSNTLLVTGCSFIAGYRFKNQKYNMRASSVFASMLLVAIVALAVPSAYQSVFGNSRERKELWLSRVTAVVILMVYLLYLYFQLFTHADLFRSESQSSSDIQRQSSISQLGNNQFDESVDNQDKSIFNDDEADEPQLSLVAALLLLFIVTVAVSICSEFLVDSIEGFTKSLHLNTSFVAVILLPIVSNSAEHSTAVLVAWRDKLDLALAVSIGSSIQIALFLIPTTVLIGWALDAPMSLNFSVFETVCLVISVLIINFVCRDGQSSWLIGALLCACYMVIGTAFYVHPNNEKTYDIKENSENFMINHHLPQSRHLMKFGPN